MRHPKIICLLSLLILFSGIPVLTIAQSYEGKTIVSIEFKGLVQTDELSVRSVLDSRVRSKFSQDTVDNDIKSLYNLDLFDNIMVDVTQKEDGVVVTYIFTELPTIREVVIKGNKKVSRIEIKDEIVLSKGSVYREEDIFDDLQSIKDLYKEKGLPYTSVEYKVVKTDEKDKETGEPKNTVDLIFTVTESEKLVVKNKGIYFSGIKAARKDDLLNLMQTKYEGYWLASGFFKEDEFEQDKLAIIRHYGGLGYIDAQIIKVDKSISFNEIFKKQEMEITIYIDEGEQYKFGGITIEGNAIFTDEELYSLIPLKEGDVFNKLEFDSNIQAIRDLFASNGYIYFNLDTDENKDRERHIISYNINVTENNKAHVEHVFITGNDKTHAFVIERELEVREGEIFNSSHIQRSREKLFNLQYFSAVNIDVKPGSEFGLVDLIFDVEEQRTGLFTFGMTYSTAGYGFGLFEEVSAINFLGRGIRLHERIELGITRQSVEVGIDEPWLFNTPTSIGLTLSASRTEYGTIAGDYVYTFNQGTLGPDGQELPDGVQWTPNPDGSWSYDYSGANTMTYVNTSYAAIVRLGRRFGKYYGINSEIGLSLFQNVPTTPDIPFEESLREQYTAGWPWYRKNFLILTGYRDTRDYIYFATKGTYISQTVGFYGGFMGGDSHFLRLNTDLNGNVKTFWKFVLSARLNFGFILPYPDLPLSIDDSDYLRIDCMNEGRGWQNYSQWGSLYARRGKAELNFSLEHRFPIEERIIWGLMFFDISNIYDEPSHFTVDFRDFYYSFGIGISFVIPNFPIRLYLTRRAKYNRATDELLLANSQEIFKDWDVVFAIAGFF
ncbi:MAG: outer membrane protein assembly factor BamA [Spirochaetota bacterium]|nr:MAG: outer membrane protein assembly factor BamA [Spirochaetota bacterium]